MKSWPQVRAVLVMIRFVLAHSSLLSVSSLRLSMSHSSSRFPVRVFLNLAFPGRGGCAFFTFTQYNLYVHFFRTSPVSHGRIARRGSGIGRCQPGSGTCPRHGYCQPQLARQSGYGPANFRQRADSGGGQPELRRGRYLAFHVWLNPRPQHGEQC